MASFTLGTASQATGTAKSTILRAIKAGRISATRDELGQWQIDPAELARTFPLLAIPRMAPAQPSTERDAPAIERDATTNILVEELRTALAQMRRDSDYWRSAHEGERAAHAETRAAHAKTQDALQHEQAEHAATRQLLLPAPKPPIEHGATAIERGATSVGEGIERHATPPVARPALTKRQRLAKFWFGREYRRRA